MSDYLAISAGGGANEERGIEILESGIPLTLQKSSTDISAKELLFSCALVPN